MLTETGKGDSASFRLFVINAMALEAGRLVEIGFETP